MERTLTDAGFCGRSRIRSLRAVIPWELLVLDLLVEWNADFQKLIRREVRANAGRGTAVCVQLEQVKDGF
jgi:hypothetical protein